MIGLWAISTTPAGHLTQLMTLQAQAVLPRNCLKVRRWSALQSHMVGGVKCRRSRLFSSMRSQSSQKRRGALRLASCYHPSSINNDQGSSLRPLENHRVKQDCMCGHAQTIKRVERLQVESRFQSTNMISVEKLENTLHCLSWLSDCAIYIANEHEVHENIPNFGFSKSPCHLLFFVRQHAHTFTNSTHTPCRLRLQSFHCIHLMNMLIVHSSANCVMFLKEQI